MHYETFSNASLFQRLQKLGRLECRIGVEILEILHVLDQRRAYAEYECDGLYTFCVKKLGYTNAQAYQRIEAMRAMREIPELKSKMEEGSLSVTVVSKVRSHIKKERKAGKEIKKSEKLGLFVAMENKTTKEVDQKLAEARGEKIYPKLVLEMDEELEALWKRVKNLSAHQTIGEDSEVLKLLAKEWLKRNDPAQRGKKSASTSSEKNTGRAASNTDSVIVSESKSQRAVPSSIKVTVRNEASSTARPIVRSRYVPASVRRAVWKRDQGKCVRCGSGYALEMDHRLAFSLGGRHELKNLQLLCRSCNQFRAIARFGIRKAPGKSRASESDPERFRS